MKVKKPKLIESVGAFYYAMNETTFDKTKYTDVVKSPIIKKVAVEPEGDATTVYASGEDYDTVSSTSSMNIEVETIAFDPEDLSDMKGEPRTKNGLILGGAGGSRPYFACGWPVKKLNGGYKYKWYPKCQLTESTDEATTKESSFSEQTSTQTIIAYAFDDTGHKYVELDSEIPETIQITEEEFFTKVITSDEDLEQAITTPTV